MKQAMRVALLGTLGGVLLTAAPIFNTMDLDGSPNKSTDKAADRTAAKPGSVVRPTPSSSVSPFPSTGTVPVVTPSAITDGKSRVSVSPSNSSAEARRTQTPVRVSPRPSASRSAPNATSRPTRKPTATPKPTKKPTVTIIGGYRACFGFAQSCIDGGSLTLYDPGQLTLAGHNYLGFQWMSRLPVGRTVKVTSGQVAGTYTVYAHAWSARASAGGKFPAAGYRAHLVLQTCEPNGTGYSLLRRV